MTVNGKRISVYMHREILGVEPGDEVDHIDQNKLNNSRGNLRICTRSANMQNRHRKDNKSGYKGVYLQYRNNGWAAQIRIDGKSKYLGYFKCPRQAARAYDSAAREAFGPQALANFPND